MISNEYSRRRYVLKAPGFPGFQREQYERTWATQATDAELEASLSFLATVLREHHGSQTVILIDEYDKVVSDGFLHGYRGEATAFLKRWLTGAIADWYDGYDFGGKAIYNPWSVLNYFDRGCVAQPYWTNTGSNEVVKRLITRAGETINAQLTSLAEGETVDVPLNLSVVFGEIDSDTSAVWPRLYLAGYVTTHDVDEPNETGLTRRLEVPNLEVEHLFRRELVDRAVAAASGRTESPGIPAVNKARG